MPMPRQQGEAEMSQEPIPTHVGWFWLCPIYAADLESECPMVWARWAWLEPLFSFSGLLEEIRIFVWSCLDPTVEPMFRFKLKPIK